MVIDGKVDYCVFMTGPGTFGVMALAEKLGLKDELVKALNQMKIVARSHKPKSALEKYGRCTKRAHSRKFERTLKGKATNLRIRTHLPQMTEDPDDNLVLEAAHAGWVDHSPRKQSSAASESIQ